MNPNPSIPGRKFPSALPRVLWITLALGLGAARPGRAQPTDSPGSSPPAAEEWHVVERGQDFAVFQRFRARAQADGSLRWQPGGRYTLLENGLHYRDPVSGQWQESRDLIESFPDGAIARYGPLRALFSHDLNAESVFDLETPAGARLRGGLRALVWLDEATGRRQLLAGVKASAPLELVPPNWLVARDAFDGAAADVVLEWRHDRFSQSVVLRKLPLPPAGLAPGTTRLVVVTEFLEAPEPEIQRVAVPGAGGVVVSDDVGIHFDGASILQGHAFAVRAGSEWALQVGAGGAPGEAVEVRKVWTPDGAGGAMLEESVAWEALARLAAELPRQARAAAPGERDWRSARAERVSARRPVEVAQLPYRPAGVVVDFVTIPDDGIPTTFGMGQTYYIRTYYYNGSAVTFQPGCVIKFKHNAYLLLYGPVSFPDTLQTPVFTSRNDDSFGEKIAGVANEPDSDGDPSKHRAAQALWIYYVDFSTTVRNARFRWAQTGIQYDVNPGVYITHTLQRSRLAHCSVGVYANLQNATLVLNQVEEHNVPTPITCPGYPHYPCGNISGIIKPAFYMTNNFRGIDGIDWETGGDDAGFVADTMGAVGNNYFVELLNGMVAVFEKNTGRRIRQARTKAFFYVSLGENPPDIYPKGSMTDPRIVYDPHSQRWFAAQIDSGSGKALLAVSKHADPVPLGAEPDLADTSWIAANWTKYLVPINHQTINDTDFLTMGLDKNGVYIAVLHRPGAPANWLATLAAIPKPPLVNQQAGPVQPANSGNIFQFDLGDRQSVIQPAVNLDANPVNDVAWLVLKAAPSSSPPYQPGKIRYARLKWNSVTSLFELQSPSSPWNDVSGNPPPPYFDIVFQQSLKAPQQPADAEHNLKVQLADVGSRLMNAVVRTVGGATYLWTCHHVGLDGGSNERYDGGTVDRSAIQWLRLQVTTGAQSLAYSAYGRVYDTASINPYWYYMPSVAVNAAGDMLLGFSASKATEYISAIWVGRRANGQISGPLLFQTGRAYVALNPRVVPPDDQQQPPIYSVRWGDYSATCVDPDGTRFWTTQEYAEKDPARPVRPNVMEANAWGTWIASVQP